jgi:hypothetical protein
MDQREKEEELNARDRKQIGVDKEEKVNFLQRYCWHNVLIISSLLFFTGL